MSYVNLLWRVDARLGLAALPPASVPLTVTSPAYDDTFAFEGMDWGEHVWRPIIDQLWRVTRPGGVVCWMVRGQIRDGAESDTPERQVLAFQAAGFRKFQTIYAKSSRFRVFPRRYFRTCTPVYVFTKGSPMTVHLLADHPNLSAGDRVTTIYREFDGSRRQSKEKVVGELGIRGDVWFYPSGNHRTSRDQYAHDHVALMHEDLARDLILSYSDRGDLVLDPFGGAGTTAKLALLNGRAFMSMEVAEKYHRIAERRIRDARDYIQRQGGSAV